MITEEEFLALPVGTVLEGWAPDGLLVAFGASPEIVPAVHEITFEKQHDGTWNTTWTAPWLSLAPDAESGNGITDEEFVAFGFDKDYRVVSHDTDAIDKNTGLTVEQRAADVREFYEGAA